jgi:hypothetical protein
VRKLAVLFVFALVFSGCSDYPFYHTAINNSSETVTAIFLSGKGEITLLPGETIEFELESGTNGEYGLKSYSPASAVIADYDITSGKCVFSDRPPEPEPETE